MGVNGLSSPGLPRAMGEAKFRNPYYAGSSVEGSASISSPMTTGTTAGFGEAKGLPVDAQGGFGHIDFVDDGWA